MRVPALLGLFLLVGVGCQPPETEQLIQGDISDLQRKVDVLNTRVQRADDLLATSRKSIAELERSAQQTRADQSVVMEDLRTELKTLKGSLDILRHDLEELSRRQDKLGQDIDYRLNDMETRIGQLSREAASKPEPETRAPSRAPSRGKGRSGAVDEITRYNQILDVLRRKDYDAAIPQFQEFVKSNPKSTYAANAQYWLAECHFAKGDYANAIKEFQGVVDRYPDSDKTCDARLKQGFAFDALNDSEKAELFLTEVLRACPKTKSASLATERLKAIAEKKTKK